MLTWARQLFCIIFLSDEDPDPVGHKKISVHLVFDIKTVFTWKVQLVADGHLTDPPSSITCASTHYGTTEG